MLEYKQGVTALFIVRLINSSSGSGQPGVVDASVTATGIKSDGSSVTLTVSGNWTELSTGSFANTGTYTLSIPGSALNLAGFFTYAISVGGCDPYIGAVKVVANEEVDTYSRLGAPAGASVSADIAQIEGHAASADTQATTAATQATSANTKLGAPAGASVSADIAAVASATTTNATTLASLLKIQTGRWKIVTTGPDANKMIIYDNDGTTPLYKFALYGTDGVTPNTVTPYERAPTS